MSRYISLHSCTLALLDILAPLHSWPRAQECKSARIYAPYACILGTCALALLAVYHV